MGGPPKVLRSEGKPELERKPKSPRAPQSGPKGLGFRVYMFPSETIKARARIFCITCLGHLRANLVHADCIGPDRPGGIQINGFFGG